MSLGLLEYYIRFFVLVKAVRQDNDRVVVRVSRPPFIKPYAEGEPICHEANTTERNMVAREPQAQSTKPNISSAEPKRRTTLAATPRGQARRLTLRVFIRICHLVEQGWAITKACESESITYSLFRLRCSENSRLQERIKEAEAIRFQRRHEEAVESVMRAGEKSWMAHAWYLERVLPNLYALKNVKSF